MKLLFIYSILGGVPSEKTVGSLCLFECDLPESKCFCIELKFKLILLEPEENFLAALGDPSIDLSS